MTSLLEKASIVHAPSGYDPGSINAVLPKYNTGVNQISSPNFENPLDWIPTDSFSISGSYAVIDANETSAGALKSVPSPTFPVAVGQLYKIQFEITDYVDGNLNIRFPNDTGSATVKANSSGNGVKTFYHIAANSSNSEIIFRLGIGSNHHFKISNISVQLMDELPVADFDFERNSTATRVNSQGLIEPMYEEGGELVVNGDFATDTDWFKGTGWSISNGKATTTVGNDTQTLRKTSNIGIHNGKTYRVQFDVLDYVSGTLEVYLGNNEDAASKVVGEINANGSYCFDFSPPLGNNGLIVFRNSTNDTSFSIDNASVVEIIPKLDTPRIDYLGGVGHWLFEPQSINFIPYSNDLSQTSSWFAVGSSTISTNQNISPAGVQDSGDLVSSNSGTLQGARIDISVVSGDDYTFSFFVKKRGTDTDFVAIRFFNHNSTFPDITAWFNISDGILETVESGLTAKIEDYGNGWYRCSATATATATDVSQIMLQLCSADGGQILGTGLGIQVFGAQLEQQSFPTTYIPTHGNSITRNEDIAENSGDSSLINSTEGVLYVEIAKLSLLDTSSGSISINDGTFNNSVLIKILTSGIRAVIRANGINETIDRNENITDIGGFNKIAFYYKSGELKVFINGSQAGAISTHTFSFNNTLDRLNFDKGGSDPFNGKVKCVAVFKEALTDGELEYLTSPSFN